VVGVDDIRYARYTDPPLTTVAQPVRQMGEIAVRVLLDLLNGGQSPSETVTLPHTLMVRASTAPPGRWSLVLLLRKLRAPVRLEPDEHEARGIVVSLVAGFLHLLVP